MSKLVLGVCLALACSAGVALAANPAPRVRFSGRTSQRGHFYRVRFVVRGKQVKRFYIVWRASCRTGRFLRMGTRQGHTRIFIHHGAWSSTGRYTGPITSGYSGKFHVLENRGRLRSASRATGSFRIVVRVFHDGRRYDRCDSGPIHWSASSHH